MKASQSSSKIVEIIVFYPLPSTTGNFELINYCNKILKLVDYLIIFILTRVFYKFLWACCEFFLKIYTK